MRKNTTFQSYPLTLMSCAYDGSVIVPTWHYCSFTFMASDHRDLCYHDTTGIYDAPKIQYTYINLCEDIAPL